MAHRLMLAILATLPFLSSSISAQQRTGTIDLYVYVSFSDNSPAAKSYKVQLSSSTRMQVDSRFTDDRGQAIFRGLTAGDYRVTVTGFDIEDAESRFTLDGNPSFESMQTEHIEVKRKAGAGTSTQGTVSAGALKIPNNARKEFELGLAAIDKKDFAGAKEHLNKAVEIYPQYCGALLDLGVIAAQERHNEEAVRLFERAVEADPTNPAASVYLASARMLQGNFKDAETLLTKVVAITPTDPDPLTMLASCQYKLGEYKEAAATAQKVHAVPHQKFAMAHYIAAEALLKQSQPHEAAEELKLYLKESPNAPNSDSAKELLASLEPK